MARDLLARGRSEDVLRMVEPLLEPIEPPTDSEAPDDHAGQAMLHVLAARVVLLEWHDVERALRLLAPFEAPAARAWLDDHTAAEVTCWLGWAHARRNRDVQEVARALSLLDEAQRLFADALDAAGRSWALIGQAHAYFTLDEYHLMRQALDEARALLDKVRDRDATCWLHDLSIPAARFMGRYDEARQHIDALLAQAHADDSTSRTLRGRAYAHRAALRFDLGHSPDDVIEAAQCAERLLSRVEGGVDYPLLAAYHAHIGALLRREDIDAVEKLIEEAAEAMQGYRLGQAHLQTLRARLALRQGRYADAEAVMEDLFAHAHHLPHGLKRSHVALLRGELYAQRGAYVEAKKWVRRAYHNACDVGHRGHQLHALLTLARIVLEHENPARAGIHLARTEAYADYFGVLPFAALRFRVLAEQARARKQLDEARTCFRQALAAYRLIGDVHRTAQIRQVLHDLSTDAAEPPEWTTMLADDLEHASVSVPLVVAAWLRAAQVVLPSAQWIGVYEYDATAPGTSWSCVLETAPSSGDLSFPAPDAAEGRAGAVRWVRLYHTSEYALHMGVALPGGDAAPWHAAWTSLRPWISVVRLALDHALGSSERRAAKEPYAPSVHTLRDAVSGFICESAAMRALARQIQRVRTSHSPVLITGEPGSGRTLAARVVHATSERREEPLLHVRCGSLQRDPLDAQLFGRATDDGTEPGLLQRAYGGTVLLDAIDALPLALQSRLVRVLETSEVLPVGAEEAAPVDVRLIATAGTDLSLRVQSGHFREDLYHRLHVIPLRVPPLRERPDDIPLLVQHFMDTLRPDGVPLLSITEDALTRLVHYGWPGNVRQLRNEIERMLAHVQSEPAPTLDASLLSDAVRAAVPALHDLRGMNGRGPHAILKPGQTLSDLLYDTERAIIEQALYACEGQITATADMLGLTRQGLYKKMKRLDIDATTFQPHEASPA